MLRFEDWNEAELAWRLLEHERLHGHMPAAPKKASFRAGPPPHIVRRREAVAALAAQGLCNRDIAARLGVTAATVGNDLAALRVRGQ